jgi:hypothetical protein
VFEAENRRLLVHLHNRNGQRRDWQGARDERQATGPAANLALNFPIASARLAVSGKPLEVHGGAGSAEVRVPPIGLYQVVEVQVGSGRSAR